jgi:carboxyl-terminal processing protease
VRRIRTAGGLLPVLLALLAPFGRSGAQALSRFDRERGLAMSKQVREDIERHYYDSTFKGVDLAASFATADARIRSAASHEQVFAGIAQAVLDLNDSHTYFMPPAYTVRVKYGWQMKMVGDSCFITHVEPKSDAAAQGLAVGDAVAAVNGHPVTRQTLWKLMYVFHLLRPQPGLRVAVQAPGAAVRQLDIAASVRQQQRLLDLTGSDGGGDIAKLIREAENVARERRPRYHELGDDVLIWKLAEFDAYDRSIDDGMRRARGRRALILDLRGNGGGDEKALLALLGSFFAADVEVGTLRERAKATRVAARGRGDKAFAGRLVVLVDSESGSASEVFARAIQLAGRGAVVGDRTAGAVMRSRPYVHQLGTDRAIFFATSVGEADLILSDGGRLEGTGVTPDVVLLPSGADLAAGRDPVLARTAETLGARLSPEEAGRLFGPR